MLGIGRKSPPIDKIETLIGPNTNFKGSLVCDGNVRIDGICEEGDIETVGNIVVGPLARVSANLTAENVSVSGVVTGVIRAANRLEVIGAGEVWGDAYVEKIYVDDDAGFHGKLMKGEHVEPPQIRPKPEAAPAAEAAAHPADPAETTELAPNQ
jgi:cytoskeletal protein CcmA (bactofilin family)